MNLKFVAVVAILSAAGTVRAFVRSGPPEPDEVVAAVLVAEAGGETNARHSMRAVFEVVRNRSRSTGQPLVVVVEEPHQFSCLNGVPPERLVALAKRHKRWNSALKIVRSAPQTNLAKGANHYCNADCHPAWAQGVDPVTRFGKLVFYKL